MESQTKQMTLDNYQGHSKETSSSGAHTCLERAPFSFKAVALRAVGASGFDRGIIKGAGIKGYGVILLWGLNMRKFQTAITRHHWPYR